MVPKMHAADSREVPMWLRRAGSARDGCEAGSGEGSPVPSRSNFSSCSDHTRELFIRARELFVDMRQLFVCLSD